MIELPWSEFKSQVLDTGFWEWIYFDYDNTYLIYAKNNDFTVECKIAKDSGADQTEFEASYKDESSTEIIHRTEGRFERSDIVLKLAKTSGQADSNGDIALDFVIPGDAGAITRYAEGGYAYVDNYTWDAAITKVEVIDVDNIFGYGANTVLKTYHDTEVAEENQGWFFEKNFGDEGSLDIEPMGWYGELRGGLTLRLTFKVAANVKVKCLIYWGKKE